MKIKKKSKRRPLKLKYSVEKKAQAHKKKLRKEMKKNPKKTKKKNTVRIPNNWPFKDQLIESLENERKLIRQEKLSRKQPSPDTMEDIEAPNLITPKTPEQLLGLNTEKENNNDYSELLIKAHQENEQFNQKMSENESIEDTNNPKYSQTTRKFYKDIRQIIDEADVLIEVLDCRDPNGCRNLELEKEIAQKEKRLVLLLNKVDLVPRDEVLKWLQYLRQFYPCEIFKASTSKNIQIAKTSYSNASEDELQANSHVFGVQQLMGRIKNYSRLEGNKKALIVVGVIGYPNVGKSSIINSLCRNAQATHVGAQPGITQKLQEILLDKKVRLIDSPGIIPLASLPEFQKSLVLLNTVQVSKIKDCIDVVGEILLKCPAHVLMKALKIPAFTSLSTFLESVAKTRGKLQKGGEYNLEDAARCVINDWNTGKIPYFCSAPGLPVTTPAPKEIEIKSTPSAPMIY